MSKLDHRDCFKAMLPVKDALEVINGKWKLLILISIENGNHRFKEIERSIPMIKGKVLAKELKELETHELISRTVYDQTPVYIEYKTTEYAETLEDIFIALREWGKNHRKRIMVKNKNGEKPD